MSQCPRAHSAENKAKISSALIKVWSKRLRQKRLGEKFFLSWARSIADAAKKGGTNQQALDWDSYDKIKEALTSQRLQNTAKKAAQSKELTKMKVQAGKAAGKKKESTASFARKRKDQEVKAKQQGREEAKGKAHRNTKKNSKRFSIDRELTLKQKLTKIRKRKTRNGGIISHGSSFISLSPTWEKLDVDLIRREEVQQEVSLADQIRAAKNKRAESVSMGTLASPSTFDFPDGRQHG